MSIGEKILKIIMAPYELDKIQRDIYLENKAMEKLEIERIKARIKAIEDSQTN